MTTIVIMLSVIGNLKKYLSISSDVEFISNYELLPDAARLIYSVGFGVPIIIYMILKFTGELTITFLHVVSIYGYSMTIFVPMIMFCVLPFKLVHWIFLLTGSLCSI